MKLIASGTILLVTMFSSALSLAADRDLASRANDLFASLGPSDPGAAVVVLKDGHLVFQHGYGVTDLRTHHKIDEHTNFRLASLTKQFTAMAIMLLVHDGKLRYDETLTEIFPEFPAYGKNITLREILNHTSGLLDYEDLMAKQDGNTPSDGAGVARAPSPVSLPDDQIPQIHDAGVLTLMQKASTTKFPSGSKWEYSNSGYCVLAMVVEKASGKNFADFLHERIFVPLKMTHTIAYENGKSEVANRAYGHTAQGNAFRETDQSSTSATLGDGGVYTSLTDLTQWDNALQHHTLLSAAEMQPALTPVHPTGSPAEENGHPVSYGFGWFLDPYHGHERMWHYGETIGFRTSIQRFPKDHVTVIVLCNRADLSAIDLALRTAELYLK